MPVVKLQGTRVLVTGANGYIGMWVVRALLEQGYAVRAVVRSPERGKHMKAYFNSYGDKLEFSIVEDITKDGAFDEAVKDVDAIEHTASPSTFALEDPNAYITPAVHGTLSILESARKFGNKVKRIVITSSVVAMYTTTTPVKATVIVDESYWNDKAIELVEEKGKEENGIVKYSASKTLAEKAAWKFREKHKNEIQWDLVTIHPSLVLGPALQEPKLPKELNVSLLLFWNMITKNEPDSELKDTINFVDVRDTAAAHVAALRKEKASDERFIVSTGACTWQRIRDIIHSIRPELHTSGVLPRGNPDLDDTVQYVYNPEKSKRVLGLEYTSIEKVIEATLADFEAKGWLGIPSKS